MFLRLILFHFAALKLNIGIFVSAMWSVQCALIASEPSMAAYNAFKPNSTIRISDEISHHLIKKKIQP